ncbi:hypothetical protein RB595_000581 [Gaeumannomyces hyphopodioides]
MATPSIQAEGDQGVIDWENLRKLIALQESQQPNLMQPEQLTAAQLRVFTELNRATTQALEMLSTTAAPEEPNFGGKDWVSLLGRYRDAHVDGSYISYRDESRGLKWCTFTKLSEAGELLFPAVGIPFSRKKDAKQYAALKAVEWLMSNQLMPDDGVNVTFKKPKQCPPTPSPAKASVTTPPRPGPTSPAAAAAKAPQTPKSRGSRGRSSSGGDNPADDYSDDDNVVAQAEKMCRAFGYGMPRYEVAPVESSANLFNGRVNWGHEWRVPASVGIVNNIYGRKPARDLMAQEVVLHLREVKQQREAAGAEALRVLGRNAAAATQSGSGSGSWVQKMAWPLGSIR